MASLAASDLPPSIASSSLSSSMSNAIGAPSLTTRSRVAPAPARLPDPASVVKRQSIVATVSTRRTVDTTVCHHKCSSVFGSLFSSSFFFFPARCLCDLFHSPSHVPLDSAFVSQMPSRFRTHGIPSFFIAVCHCDQRPSRFRNAAALLLVSLRLMLTQVTINLLQYYGENTRSTGNDSVLLYVLEGTVENVPLHYPSSPKLLVVKMTPH